MSTENLLPPTCPWCLPWSLDTGRRTEGSLDISPGVSTHCQTPAPVLANSGRWLVLRTAASYMLQWDSQVSGLRSQFSGLKSY